MEFILEPKVEIPVPRFSSEVEERMEDLSHRVLDQGITDAIETLGILDKKLAQHAEDEFAFWFYLSEAYQKAYNYNTTQRSTLSQPAVALQYKAIQQALTLHYLQGKTQDEALAIVMDGARLQKYLLTELHAVAQRLLIEPLAILLQGGYKQWRERYERHSRTPLWSAHPNMRIQVQHLLERLKQNRFVPGNTQDIHFYMLLTSSRPPYRVIWSQKGLASLIYLLESLLREGHLQAPTEVLKAAIQKKPLEHDKEVMPWLYDCICNGFLTVDRRGTLKEITREKLMESRISSLRDWPRYGRLPTWALKINQLVDELDNLL